jgi:hypothetical protein
MRAMNTLFNHKLGSFFSAMFGFCLSNKSKSVGRGGFFGVSLVASLSKLSYKSKLTPFVVVRGGEARRGVVSMRTASWASLSAPIVGETFPSSGAEFFVVSLLSTVQFTKL